MPKPATGSMISVGIAFTPDQIALIDYIRTEGMAPDVPSRSEFVRGMILFALDVIDQDPRALADYPSRCTRV